MKDPDFVAIAHRLGIPTRTGGAAIAFGKEVERMVRASIIQRLRNSAFMYTHVNPEHVLLTIRWDCTLLDAIERDKCPKCNDHGELHNSTCPAYRDEVARSMTSAADPRMLSERRHSQPVPLNPLHNRRADDRRNVAKGED